MKLILKLVVLLFAGMVALSAAGFVLVPPAARAAVNKGSEYAFGVPATIGKIKASPGLSQIGLGFSDYVLSSPVGFDEPLLSIGHFSLGIGTSTILGGVKDVDTFVIEDVTLTLEQSGTSNNLVPVLQHLRGLASAGEPADGEAPGEPQADREGAPGPRLRIGTVRFSGIAARLRLGGIPGIEEVDERFEIPSYERDWSDVTGSEGKTVAEIAGLIVEDLKESALRAAEGKIPPTVLAALKSTLEGGLDGGVDAAKGALKAEADALEAKAKLEAEKAAAEAQEKADGEVDKAKAELKKGFKGILGDGL